MFTPKYADSSNPTHIRFTRIGSGLMLTLTVCTLWALIHQYRGISQDAELYSLQALAKLYPALTNDVYLQNISQDKFSIFSEIYAGFIRFFGLWNAAVCLFIVSTCLFLVFSWKLVRDLFNPISAWLSVSMLVISTGAYGAFDVFHYMQDFLTARSLAEALIVSSLYLEVSGFRRSALLTSAAALLVHPLMALPGVLTLIFFRMPIRQSAIAATAGIFATLAMAYFALLSPNADFLKIIDPVWLGMLYERSKFLFLQRWTVGDWMTNLRPFLSLALTIAVIRDKRVTRLCSAAALVGASGLVVALIASTTGPVAILIQGQAWRWVWITAFAGILLIAPTVLQIWREPKCGLMCAILLIVGWTFPESNGALYVGAALLLWLSRSYVSEPAARYLRWGSVALAAVILAWILANCWNYSLPTFNFLNEPIFVQRVKNVFGMGLPAVLFAWILWYLSKSERAWLSVLLCSALLLSSVSLFRSSFSQARRSGSPSEIAEFEDWRRVIPPTSSVYVADGKDSPAFAWFTLRRPSYMSLDQSAGVVFSRRTAVEINRRSAVLQPLMDPDWKLQSRSEQHGSGGESHAARVRPVTAPALISICRDPQIGFIVAKEQLGTNLVRHEHMGAWKDWNLYDCDRFRIVSLTE